MTVVYFDDVVIRMQEKLRLLLEPIMTELRARGWTDRQIAETFNNKAAELGLDVRMHIPAPSPPE